MPRVVLDMASLAHLDNGRIGDTFRSCVEQMVKDIELRPNEPKDRSVTMTVKFTPLREGDGSLLGVNTKCEFKTKTPSRASRDYPMGMTPEGNVYYEDLHPQHLGKGLFDDQDNQSTEQTDQVPGPTAADEAGAANDNDEADEKTDSE